MEALFTARHRSRTTGPSSLVVLIAIGALAFGQVRGQQKISASVGGLPGAPTHGDRFGRSAQWLGDVDEDGLGEVAVGQPGGGAQESGTVRILTLRANGTVAAARTLTPFVLFGAGEPPGAGTAVAALGDLDGNGVPELAVGVPGDDLGGVDAGTVRIMFLSVDGSVVLEQLIGNGAGGFAGVLPPGAGFGSDVDVLGDLDGNGIADLAVGAPGADGTGTLWILFLRSDGSVRSEREIASGRTGFPPALDTLDGFGHGCAGLGDLDGDGTPDVAVGARGDDDGGNAAGAVWILFLRRDGSVGRLAKITPRSPGFHGDVAPTDGFGADVANLGDLDGDALPEIGVSTQADDDGGSAKGGGWILHPRRDGSVRALHKLSALQGGFEGALKNGDLFGLGLFRLGDLDGDGVPELAAGAPGDDDGGASSGALWILFTDGRALGATAEYRTLRGASPTYRAWGDHAGAPVPGGTLELSVVTDAADHAHAAVLASFAGTRKVLSNGQTLFVDLLDPPGPFLLLQPAPVPLVRSFLLPTEVALDGLTLHTQALHLGGAGPIVLANGIVFAIGPQGG